MEKKKPTCPGCRITFFRQVQPLSMIRLYVKVDGKFKVVGWICPNCLHVKIDRKEPIKRFKHVS